MYNAGMPGWVGKTLGKASVELLLARDESSEVYLGRHRGLQRAVAIKIFTAIPVDEPSVLADFQFAARNLEALQHPRIAPVLESGRAEGYPYLIMEYVPGTSLASHLRALGTSKRRFDPEHILQLVKDVSEGLDFAHKRGVLHRELKPSSILLTSASAPVEAGKTLPGDFRAVLTDFSLAPNNGGPGVGPTPPPSVYSAPEHASGEAVDARADVYSLGAITYELLSGRSPAAFEATSTGLESPQLRHEAAIDDLPKALRDVLERALQQDPAGRYGGVLELASAYESAMSVPSQVDAAVVPTGQVTPSVPSQPAQRRSGNWISTAVVAAAILLLAALLGTRALIGAQPAPTSAPDIVVDIGHDPEGASVPEAGDPVGILRFQDGAALIDEVSFNATGMPALEPGSQYEVWLLDASGEERRSVGYLKLDPDGAGSTSLVDPEGRNLLAEYHSLEVTVEPDPDQSPNPAGAALFTATLPEEGLLHVRHLLVSFSRAPAAIGLLDGLVADAQLLDATARSMLASYEAGDDAGTRSEAESMLNLLVGSQSPDHADWDGDGQIEDPGDGYGLLLNGENSGYIQGSIAHAGFAAMSETATTNMQSHGDHVIVSARNLEAWAPELRDLLKQILQSSFDPAMGGLVRQSVALSHNFLAGTDLNGNERVEAIAGEGGAETAYQHALYMADIVISLPN